MLNYLWAGMIGIGIVYGAVNGTMKEVTEVALESATEGISLCIAMAGVMALWVGLMEIAKEAGMIQKLTKSLGPFVSFLFPNIPKEHPAREYISTNIIANLLGLGWASTPAGLKAMEKLSDLQRENRKMGQGEEKEGTASDEMCTFLILNISSLQLIPVTIIAYRQQYGSLDPTAVIGPGIIATLISTGVAIIYCKLKQSGKKKASYSRE